MRIACRGKSLQHQRGLVESSLASSDTLLPSMCKDADGTQELKLKIYEVLSSLHCSYRLKLKIPYGEWLALEAFFAGRMWVGRRKAKPT